MTSLLIVDDDPTLLDVLSELFSAEYACRPASTAEEALGLLSSVEYDVVITDIAMPGMSGEAVLGFVKAHSPGTPVIIISGVIDRGRAERLKVKGAFGYLLKPFRAEELKSLVARAAGGRA